MTDEMFCLILITSWPFNAVITCLFLHLSHELDFREMWWRNNEWKRLLLWKITI